MGVESVECSADCGEGASRVQSPIDKKTGVSPSLRLLSSLRRKVKLPNGGKVRISPTIRLLSIISLSIFPNITFSCVDTQLYGSFDRTHIYQLLKSVIFTQPLCLPSSNSSDFCKVVASKRVSDFLVGIIGDDALLPEQLKVVNDQLTLTLGQIYEDTGIRGSTTRSAQQKGIQQIVFLNLRFYKNIQSVILRS